jgi:tRNA (mo5U34)-methyltransferase
MDTLRAALPRQVERLERARDAVSGVTFYAHDTLGNVVHLDSLLTGHQRDLDALAGGGPVADIGAADGDLSFVLEDVCGWEMDIIDWGATSANGLQGARALRDELGSRAAIHEIDLDRQFTLPRDRYGLILLLGILYHLQNPFFVLRHLADHADNCLLSTRVARLMGPQRTRVADLPVAYLVGPDELNSDPTNYWVLSQAGLERLVERAGWEVSARLTVGDTAESDTFSAEHDERCFMLLRSVG